MIIPTQLQSQKFIKTSEKIPTEPAWQKTANYSLSQFLKFNLKTYGVLCGKALMVVDCDEQYIADKLLTNELFHKTFIVKTATKKLPHFYFKVINNPNDGKGFRLNNKNGDRIIDLQGAGTFVIGPNSQLSNGKTYNVLNDNEIQEIDYQFLRDILLNLEPGINDIKVKKSESTGIELDEICASIKNILDIADLLPEKAQQQNPTMCPLGHTSVNKKCFSYTDKVFKCFHCEEHGNIFQLYMKINHCDFLTAKKALAKKAGLDDDLKVKVLTLYADEKKRHYASELLAREIKKIFKIKTIRHDEKHEMWIYRAGIYVPEAKTYIEEFCRGIMQSLYKTFFVSQVTAKIAADTFITEADFFINEDLNLVPVKNGVLNLKTRELLPFSSSYKFFTKLPVYYDKLIKPQLSLKFLKDILSSPEDLAVIQELIGYLLFRDYKYEKAFMLLGKGRNGKSKLLELIKRFLGAENCSSVSLQTLESNNFSVSNLFNKLANISSDLSKTSLKETGVFKSLTGHDYLTADRKFLTPVYFVNHAKLIFACNDLPYSYDESAGFFDRWIILDFKYKFIDKPKAFNEKLCDKFIIDKVAVDKELSGLLNWALDGLDRLFLNDKLSQSSSTDDVKLKWKCQSSSFNAFLVDEVVVDFDSYISIGALSRAYSDYCQINKLKPESQKAKTPKLETFGAWQKLKKVGDKLERVWCGVKFKNIKTLVVGDFE